MAGDSTPLSEITFIGSSNRLASRVGRPVRRFLEVETAGGVVLLIATAIALLWANSPWKDSYHDLWQAAFQLELGSYVMGGGHHHLTLELLVNDGLMAIFFFVVGLEIKRELVDGALKDRKAAALPAMAALGGMVVPALIFFALNSSGPASQGWGIPMATDIAFAVGVVSLLGNKVSRSMKVFLLTLAIVDDIGAIVVIAVFYTESLQLDWLAASVVVIGIVIALKAAKVWYIPLYVLLGVILWLCMFESGIHATIAGVVLGLITPAKPLQSRADAAGWVEWLRNKDENLYAVDIRHAAFHMRESVSVAERLETALHPISSFVIIPIFALANAGVYLGGGVLGNAVGERVTWGVALGLVAGKTVGVFGATWIGQRLPFTRAPAGMTNTHLLGLSAVSGIGFTVALFITGLAFEEEQLIADAKIGILFASVAAGALGLLLLSLADNKTAKVSPAKTKEEVLGL